MSTQPVLDTVLNKIHAWNQPEHHPLKRMGLTRIGGLACVALEAISLLYAALMLGIQTCNTLVKCQQLTELESMWRTSTLIYQLILGMISSALFGVIVSPEVNFRIHQKITPSLTLMHSR